MKICYLAGANSIHSHRWIKYFAEKGHKIYWISFSPSIEPLNNISHYFYRMGNIYTDIFIKSFKIRKLIQKIHPDILHAHYAGIYGFIGTLVAFHPFIVTVWGSDLLLTEKSRIKGPFVRWVLYKADLVTCDAQYMKNIMVSFGIDSEKINIIYFGTDIQKFHPFNKNQNVRMRLNLGNSPVIISLRNLEPIYDVGTLIRSIPIVLKKIPEAKFIIAGKGSEEKRLKDLAKSLNISNSIRFIGFVPNGELPQYLTSSDIYVSTSLSDAGLSASTAEAMACGLPVIVTDIGENNLWIENYKNGFLVPVKNPQILAEKIIYLIKNPDKRKLFGEEGRSIIVARDNYYKEMEKVERLYEKLTTVYSKVRR